MTCKYCHSTDLEILEPDKLVCQDCGKFQQYLSAADRRTFIYFREKRDEEKLTKKRSEHTDSKN